MYGGCRRRFFPRGLVPSAVTQVNATIVPVKIVTQVKLMPDAVQTPALERTLPAINEAANWVSAVSFEHFKLKGSVRELRKRCYGELKDRGLGHRPRSTSSSVWPTLT